MYSFRVSKGCQKEAAHGSVYHRMDKVWERVVLVEVRKKGWDGQHFELSIAAKGM